MSKNSLISLCKKDAINIYNHAIESIRPDRLVKNSVSISSDHITVKDSTNQLANVELDLRNRSVHLIGGGKSVLTMALGISELAEQAGVCHKFSYGCLSLPLGVKRNLETRSRDLLRSIKVICMFGSENNLPDNGSICASEHILEHISRACHNDRSMGLEPLFIVVISGGGSACLTSPRHINLDEKLSLINFLIQKGANIVELNMVRRFFSSIKGGKLARFILKSHPGSQILTLILSDVIGDPIEYIASGPTFLDQNNNLDHKELMLNVLKKYGFQDIEYIKAKCESDEASVIDSKERVVINRVIGNNTIALRAATDRARSLGYKVGSVGNDLQGSPTTIVAQMSRLAEQIPDERVFIIGGGEVTIKKSEYETWGKGGRAQEMTLDYMISRLSHESHSKESNVDLFLAGGTDGQDGPTDVAACLASYSEWIDDKGKSFSMSDALDAKSRHDSYNFWSKFKPDWLIKTGLTGTNVMDLYMYLVRIK